MRFYLFAYLLVTTCNSDKVNTKQKLEAEIFDLEAQIESIDSTQQVINTKIIRKYDSIRSKLTFEQIERLNISGLQIQEIADSSMYLDPMKYYLQFQLSTLNARYDSINSIK